MTHVARRNVTGVLVAGGASSRMGQDKATMDFVGAPMISWCAAALAECSRFLVVVSSSEQHAVRCARAVEGAWPRFTVLRGVEVAARVDESPGLGPLAGLAAGMAAASTDQVVLSGCDTPLVPAAFYRRALESLADHDAAMPDLGAPEPLISAWRRESALREAPALLAAHRGPRAIAEVLRVRLVRSDELVAWGMDPRRFASANTPEAAAQLAALARASP